MSISKLAKAAKQSAKGKKTTPVKQAKRAAPAGKSDKEVTMEEVALSKIVTDDKHQPRQQMNDDQLDLLANSIKQNGLLYPITVVRSKSAGNYNLIDGHRRLLALRKLKIKSARCLIRPPDTEEQIAIIQLIANTDRAEICLTDQAMFIRRLKNEYKINQKKLAGKLNFSEGNVSKMIHVANFIAKDNKQSRELLELVRNDELIGLSTIYEFTMLNEEEARQAVEDKKEGKGLTRQNLESRRVKQSRGKPPESQQPTGTGASAGTSAGGTDDSKEEEGYGSNSMDNSDFIDKIKEARFVHNGVIYGDGEVSQKNKTLVVTYSQVPAEE